MVLHLSDLEPSCCEIQELGPPPSSNNDQDKMGYILIKKHQHPRTEDDGGDDDNTELARKKKAKMNNSETEADSSSSDHSCFVALVTASNLHTDALYLPKDFTSSNVLKRKYRKIVLTDGGERSWALDLRFNKSCDTFYITRGWRSFCDENGRKEGGLFVFKLVGNRETPLLSFSSTESFNDGTDKNDKESCMEMERMKNHLRCRDSTSPIENRFVTLTFTHESFRRGRLCLPLPFMRENGLDKPQLITLLGKDGMKWKANLRRESTSGRMKLGKGLKDFAKANGLKTGESFTLESIWKDKTPMLSLLRIYPSSDRRQQGEYCSKASEKEFVSTKPNSQNRNRKAKNNTEERSSWELVQNKCLTNRRNSISLIENRFVTLTLTHKSFRKGTLCLPLPFMRENGLEKPRLITLLGKDGAKWVANLRRESTSGRMRLGKGWKDFAKANGLMTGACFTLELIWKDTTPMLSLFRTDSSSDRLQRGENYSKASQKESLSTEPSCGNIEERRYSSPGIQNQFVTLTLKPEDVRDCKLILPSQFMKANGIDKLGKITLFGKERMKCSAYLLSRDRFVALGIGWKGFCEANGVKTGESFTLECINEQDTTPVFKFCSISGV